MTNTVKPEADPSAKPTYEELNQRLYVAKRRLRDFQLLSHDLDDKINLTRLQIEQNKHFSSSLSYLLGTTLIKATKSPTLVWKLPVDLLTLFKLGRQRKAIKLAKQLLNTNGYHVSRASERETLQSSKRPTAPLVRAEPRYRKTFDELVQIASTIPDSNGSQYYRPLELNVAIVTDEFMFNYYRDIFKNVLYVTPNTYADVFKDNEIHLFLYVSCWSGIKNDEWRGLAYREKPKNALNHILEIAREKSIPTVFQTIEDPSNYEHYLPIAQMFDHILTTDTDCIPRYQRDTKAKSVSFGEYGVNPLFNNPIGMRRRIYPGAFFAGSYPSRYAERCQDMHTIFDSLIESKYDLIIADRNSDKSNDSVAFPSRYSAHLVPKIDHKLLQKIHKVFKYNTNFNSIKNSPTMCAMRIYELQAQGSLLLSNYAKSVVNNFPLVDVINTKVNAAPYFNETDSLSDYEKQVAGIRTIMSGKTGYEQARLMLKNIGIPLPEHGVPLVVVLVEKINSQLSKMFDDQKYPNKRLIEFGDIQSIELPEQAYYAFFKSEHEYERHYLCDMVNGFKYTNSRYITKAAYFDNRTLHDGPQHEYVTIIPSIYRTVFDAKSFDLGALLAMSENHPCEGGYAIDPFELNYSRYIEGRNQQISEYALSVIVPVFNNGEFLRYKCIESLRRNALFKNMEIILVDDGSTDSETITTVNLIQRRYSNVKVFRFNDGGSGSASRPRNKGVQLASAPLVTFLDPDNEISPGGYDKLHALFVREQQQGRPLDLVAGYQVKVAAAQTITAKHTEGELTVFDNPKETVLLGRKFPIISTQAAVIRKEFLARTKVDFVENAVGQDTLYGHELLAHATRVGFSGHAHIIYYAERIDSVTNSLNLRFFQKSLVLEKAQYARLSAAGLLDEYVNIKFNNFFEGWYLQKLKLVDDAVRPAAVSILCEILTMYGVPPSTFNSKGFEV